MVISCLYTYSMQRGTSPHGRQLCSQPEVSEAEGFRADDGAAAAAAAAWTPPVGVKWKVHRPYHLRITAGICKHKCVRSRVAVDFTLSSKTLLHRLRRRKKRNVVQAYNGRAQHPLHNASEHVPSASDIANLIRFFFPPPQIIKDRVFSHISRNKYMWNSLPGGLLVLPEYSTHLAHFPFYYLGLGNHAPHSNESAQHANPDCTGWS